jgi:hypothetical protein
VECKNLRVWGGKRICIVDFNDCLECDACEAKQPAVWPYPVIIPPYKWEPIYYTISWSSTNGPPEQLPYTVNWNSAERLLR